MTQPIHTPGPVITENCTVYALNGRDTNRFCASVQPGYTLTGRTDGKECEANARLLAAAYNAFDSAAKKLGANAVELAERMQDGDIAELVEALDYLLGQTVDMDLKHGITLSEGEEEARARGIAVLAKVRGAS